MRHMDNKGYLFSYVVEVEVIGETANVYIVEIFIVFEIWVLKNVVCKWYVVRNMMFE